MILSLKRKVFAYFTIDSIPLFIWNPWSKPQFIYFLLGPSWARICQLWPILEANLPNRQNEVCRNSTKIKSSPTPTRSNCKFFFLYLALCLPPSSYHSSFPSPKILNHLITVEDLRGADPKKTALFDIDVEVDDTLKDQMKSFLLSTNSQHVRKNANLNRRSC